MLTKKDKKFLNDLKDEIIKSKDLTKYQKEEEILNNLADLCNCSAKVVTNDEGADVLILKLSAEIDIPVDLNEQRIFTNDKVKNIMLSNIIKLKDMNKIKDIIEKIKKGELDYNEK